jgi:hypothetical protein
MSNTQKELRREPRFQSAGIGDLTIVNSSTFPKLSVTIVDVSRSGLQIELDEPLQPGGSVEVRLRDTIVMGEVRHCRPFSAGRYRVGMATSSVIGPH